VTTQCKAVFETVAYMNINTLQHNVIVII